VNAVFRFFDVLLACIGSLALFIPMVVIALLLKRSGISPVIFKQQRPGLSGRIFWIHKFRTMTDETDESGALLPDEERLTNFGAFLRRSSLDELPSLLNVFKGEMSIVGPRPLLPEYLPLYSDRQSRRHEVSPGVTGWAQINGRNALSWEEKFELDVWYIDNRSIFLYFKIIWMTILRVIKGSNISADGYATMPDFVGSDSDIKGE